MKTTEIPQAIAIQQLISTRYAAMLMAASLLTPDEHESITTSWEILANAATAHYHREQQLKIEEEAHNNSNPNS